MGKQVFDILVAHVAGCNPHDVGVEAQRSYPADEHSRYVGVRDHQWDAELQRFTSGSIEFDIREHPTVTQESWLRAQPCITNWQIIQER